MTTTINERDRAQSRSDLVSRLCPDNRTYLTLLLLFIGVGTFRDAELLYRHQVAVGDDGYYYVLQVTEIIRNGHLYFSTSSRLFLYLAAAASWLSGEPIPTIKALSLVLHAVLSLGIFSLVRILTDSVGLGLFGGALSQLSSLHLYFIGEFNSNLFGLAALIWAIVLVFRSWDGTTRFRWVERFLGFLLLFGACLGHKSVAPLLLVVCLCILIFLALVNGHRSVLPTILLVSLIWASPALLTRFFPRFLPQWAMGSFQFHGMWPVTEFARVERLTLLLASGVFLAVSGRFDDQKSRRSTGVFGGLAIFSLLMLLNPFFDYTKGSTNFSGRMALLSYIVAAILLPGLTRFFLRTYKLTVRLAALVVTALFIQSALSPGPFGIRNDYLIRRERLVASLTRSRDELQKYALLMARPGDQYLVTAVLQIPSQAELPKRASGKKLAWLLDLLPRASTDKSTTVLWPQGAFVTAIVSDASLRTILLTGSARESQELEFENVHLYWATHAGRSDVKIDAHRIVLDEEPAD